MKLGVRWVNEVTDRCIHPNMRFSDSTKHVLYMHVHAHIITFLPSYHLRTTFVQPVPPSYHLRTTFIPPSYHLHTYSYLHPTKAKSNQIDYYLLTRHQSPSCTVLRVVVDQVWSATTSVLMIPFFKND